MNHFIGSKAIKFLIVGGSATIFQFILLIIFIELFDINKVIGSAVSFSLSSVANYYLNYHFTFSSDKKHRETLPKFIVVVLLGLLINTLSFSVYHMFIYYLWAQVFATLTTLIINYILHKYWMYRSE